MKRLALIALVVAGLLVSTAPAPAATPSNKVLAKQIKTLQKQVKALQAQVRTAQNVAAGSRDLLRLRVRSDGRRVPGNVGDDRRRLEPRLGAADDLRAADAADRLHDVQRVSHHACARPGPAEHLGVQRPAGDLQVGRISRT